MENTKMNENETNWDTKEAYLVLTNNERYFNGIKDNAKTFNGFKLFAGRRIDWHNRETQSEMRININNIDWKWVYNGFMELI